MKTNFNFIIENVYPFSLTQSGLLEDPLVICEPYKDHKVIERIEIINILQLRNFTSRQVSWHVLCSREYKRNPKNILSHFEYIPKGYDSYHHAKESAHKILSECPCEFAFDAGLEKGLLSIPFLRLATYYDMHHFMKRFYNNPCVVDDLIRHEKFLKGEISSEKFLLN